MHGSFIPIEQLIHLNKRTCNYRAAILQAKHLNFTCTEHEVKVWQFLQHNIFLHCRRSDLVSSFLMNPG